MIALQRAERLVLGSLIQPSAAAIRVVDDLPAEAFADPSHQNVFWRLIVGTNEADDADLAADFSSADVAPEADVDAACRLIRTAWAERRQRGAGVLWEFRA